MTKKIYTGFLFIIMLSEISAQNFFNSTNSKTYKSFQVLSADSSISIYDKLNKAFGGDSIRLDSRNQPFTGWVEDKYENGAALHKGYYIDGTVSLYKNYFENGKLERSVEAVIGGYLMQVYYPDSKLRYANRYSESGSQMEKSCYRNGQVAFVEEYNKSGGHLVKRNSYEENGTPKESLELVNKKKDIYYKTEYFENGYVKDEGTLQFFSDSRGFMKDGKWKTYTEDGNLLKEEMYVQDGIVNPGTEEHLVKQDLAQLPVEFASADTDKDGHITPFEITACVDQFFEGNPKLSPEYINKLIEFFFNE